MPTRTRTSAGLWATLARVALALVAVLGLVTAAAANEKPAPRPDVAPRLALVIGNSAYANVAQLANPRADATLLAAILRERLGFEVRLVLDADRPRMLAAIEAFAAELKAKGKDSVGLVYFAGHGFEHGGANFLAPIDLALKSEDDIARHGVSVDEIANLLSSAGNQLNMLVLDACRNNPFRKGTRSLQARGLSPMGSVVGVYIASATAAGDEAFDGDGTNSPYTAALAEAIVVPGLKLEDVFKSVRRRVRLATQNKQIPWESSSLEVDFYFLPPAPQEPATAQPRDTAVLEGGALNAAIQRELVRIGCLSGAASERFDAVTIQALRAFALLTDDKFHWHRPTMAALRALRRFAGKAQCAFETATAVKGCFKVGDDQFCR